MEPISAALILAGLAASSAATLYTNKKNIEYAQDANDTSIALANTAHQREVRDLKAAGLNPILSASGSGASVPQLKVPDLSNPLANAETSARSLAESLNGQVDSELRTLEADANSAESQSKMLAREEELSKFDTAINLVERQARLQALVGDPKHDKHVSMDRYPGDSPVWYGGPKQTKAYKDLVKMYRRQMETGAYDAMMFHSMLRDVDTGLNSAKSVGDLIMTGKKIKAPVHPPQRERVKSSKSWSHKGVRYYEERSK